MTLPTFKNPKLFEQAFIHRSYLNEAPDNVESNERLEFLGDSILSFFVSDYLYRTYPQYDEGVLTNLRSLLVNTKSLAQLSQELSFGDLLKLSKGEREAGGNKNQSLLADCFEAFVGALFIDSGEEVTKQFVSDSLLVKIPDIVAQKSFKDPKSLLQEYTQAQKKGSPVYQVINEEGPAHARTFTIEVKVANVAYGTGSGKSKQEAEEEAAKLALEKLEEK